MRKFWGVYKNESYSVGCNGSTVYIYDSTGTELAKFRDFPYAYTAVFKPNSNVIAVKSTVWFSGSSFMSTGFFNIDKKDNSLFQGHGAQEQEGFAFNTRWKVLSTITCRKEPDNSCQRTQLSIYDAVSFERMKTLFTNEKT